MLYEITYRESEQGILKGTSRFCPVAITDNTPKAILKPLHEQSLRRANRAARMAMSLDTPLPASACRDYYLHSPVRIAGETLHLINRGIDITTGEPTPQCLVHQILVAPEGLPMPGPAALLAGEDCGSRVGPPQPTCSKRALMMSIRDRPEFAGTGKTSPGMKAGRACWWRPLRRNAHACC